MVSAGPYQQHRARDNVSDKNTHWKGRVRIIDLDDVPEADHPQLAGYEVVFPRNNE